MSLLPFTQKANDALVAAKQRATQDQHPELVPQHLFGALLAPDAGLHALLERAGLTQESIQGLADAAEHARAAQAAGAVALDVMPPHHWLRFGFTPGHALQYFEAIHRAAPDLDLVGHHG